MGNILVGQSGGPTAVINSSLSGVISEARSRNIKVYGMINGIQGFMEEKYIDLSKYIKNDYDMRILKQTPGAFLGSCRYILPNPNEDDGQYERIFNLLEKLDISIFLYIGGNDSMDTVMKLDEYGLRKASNIRFIGIPKTIDNDLLHTDHTPGYGSCAKFVATVTKETRRDIEAYNSPSFTVMEIMGRNSGWICASSKLSESKDSKGPDLIYLAESRINLEDFLDRVNEKIKREKNLLVCISEGIKLEDGRYISELSESILHEDIFGHKQLTGAGNYLSSFIYNRLKIKTRAIELNTIQRSAGHILSRTDQEEAFNEGAFGLKLALEGFTGRMVCLERLDKKEYEVKYVSRDVRDIANFERKFPLEWIDEEKKDVKKEFIDYARPLISGQVDIVYEDGIVKHINR